MLHIPLLRRGEPYQSLDVIRIPHCRTGERFVEVSQANSGLIRRDLLGQEAARESLASLPSAELLKICARADVTALYRGSGRLVYRQGACYLLPTILLCQTADHPLANREFLFPFASVVEVCPEEIPQKLGPSLVVTAITSDPKLIGRLVAAPHIGRLNLGAIPTSQVSWDQPHEGNLFEHLYSRRAFQHTYELVLR